LIKTTDDKVALTDVFHEKLVALQQKLLATLQLLIHEGQELLTHGFLELEGLLYLVLIVSLVLSDQFKTRPRFISRMKTHSGVFKDESEQSEIGLELATSFANCWVKVQVK